MTQRILITGAAGFIGRHVAAAYARRGMHVTGIGRGEFAEREKFGFSEWHQCEVTLDTLTQHAGRPDVIVHCAGGSSVGLSVQQPYHDFIQTVDTAAQVLEFMRLCAPTARLVYPSSGAVYGRVAQLPITEEASLQPISPYGVHKLMAEQLCKSYAENYGLSLIVVRLFSVYGKGLRKQLLWDACQKITAGRNDFFGSGSETRDWLHVSDAAALLMVAAEHADVACPIVNGGAGMGVTVQKVLMELYDALGQLGRPEFNDAIRAGDPAHFQADIRHAQGWGWQPRISWQEGLREYAAWFREGAL